MIQPWIQNMLIVGVISGFIACVIRTRDKDDEKKNYISEFLWGCLAGVLTGFLIGPEDGRQIFMLGLFSGFNAEMVNQNFKARSLKAIGDQKTQPLKGDVGLNGE